MRRLMTILVAVLLAVPLLALPAVAADGDAELSVVHGIPGLAVDVYANGDAVLEDWTFGNVAGPLPLPAGDYLIEIYGAGADTSGDPALSGTVVLPPAVTSPQSPISLATVPVTAQHRLLPSTTTPR